MTTKDVIAQVKSDKGVPSRFPMRILLIEDYAQYREVAEELAKICDRNEMLADFCADSDVYPNFTKVQKLLENHPGQEIALYGVGEYLRIGMKREQASDRQQFVPLWGMQQAASSTSRLIVPLYACSDIWQQIIKTDDERKVDYTWTVERPAVVQPSIQLDVYSPGFKEDLSEINTCYGIKSWLSSWEHLVSRGEKCRLVTRMYANMENSVGTYIIKTIDSPFDYLCSNLQDTARLKKEWGTEENWKQAMAAYLPEQKSLQNLILSKLNQLQFDAPSLLGQWGNLTQFQQWLFWLWYQVYPTTDYYSYVACHAADYTEIPHDIYFDLFTVDKRTEKWMQQRNVALEKKAYMATTAELETALQSMPQYMEQLQMLACTSHAEKALAISIVGKWLKTGAAKSSVLQAVQNKFPMLYEYLAGKTEIYSDDLNYYFDNYRNYKIRNELPETHELATASIPLDDYDARYSCLHPFDNEDGFILWIDALGAEWVPLLQKKAANMKYGDLQSTKLAAALLPTETCYNDIWHDMVAKHKKLDKLDKLAHTGLPDDKNYYSCMVHQFDFMQTIVDTVDELLKEHPTVVVTGDHGTSRLAALAFHAMPGITAPAMATPKSSGRFCELGQPYDKLRDDIGAATKLATMDGKQFLVMSSYQHYSQKGNVAGSDAEAAIVGEVHGGATPEEVLVPVMVFKSNKVTEKPISYKIEKTNVYRLNGGCTLQVKFTKPIQVLRATMQDRIANCTTEDSSLWNMDFKAIEQGTYKLLLYADDHQIKVAEPIVVKTNGIQQDDDPFGGI